MSDRLAVALAQVNPVVGDIDGNLDLIRRARHDAGDADLVVLGELVVAGYPPEDLVLKRQFQDRLRRAVEAFVPETADGGPAVLLGAPWRVEGALRNVALLIEGGAIRAVVLKHDLPNYGVFDEKRVFAPGPLPRPGCCG